LKNIKEAWNMMRGMAEMFGIAGIVRGGEFSAATFEDN
jgi:hypothetical protein